MRPSAAGAVFLLAAVVRLGAAFFFAGGLLRLAFFLRPPSELDGDGEGAEEDEDCDLRRRTCRVGVSARGGETDGLLLRSLARGEDDCERDALFFRALRRARLEGLFVGDIELGSGWCKV